MPASTGASPSYVTRSVPSNAKPSTGVPSGASALAANIPAFDPRRLAVDLDRALLAGEQVDHVVGADCSFDHDPDRGGAARVSKQRTVTFSFATHRGRREMEERRK